MVIDKNYFLARLANGEDIDRIGEDIADMMNAAVAEYEAKQEANQKAQAKKAIMRDIVDCIAELAALEGVDPIDFETSDEELDMLVQSFTEMFQALNQIKKLGVMLENAAEQPIPQKNKPVFKAPKSDDEVLSDFIASLLS
jgi:hypothetical protein